MNAATSRYLDTARAVAALLVLVAHSRSILNAPVGFLGDFAGEAVAVFFVISGYVIAYASHGKAASSGDYIVARAARILPVALIALLFTFAVDGLGQAASPEAYAAAKFFNPNTSLTTFLTCITFMNELWTSHVVFGSDEPYWSLANEVWYYAAWGILLYARGFWRTALFMLVVIIGGPKFFFYFPLWLLGAGLYFLQQRPDVRVPALGIGGRVIVAAALLGVVVALKYQAFYWLPGMLGFIDRDHILPTLGYFYLVGVAFMLSVLLLAPSGSEPPQASLLQRLLGWVAGISFTLYLVHQPALQFAYALLPQVRTNGALALVLLVAVVALAGALALVTERPRRLYREAIAFALSALVAGLPAPLGSRLSDYLRFSIAMKKPSVPVR